MTVQKQTKLMKDSIMRWRKIFFKWRETLMMQKFWIYDWLIWCNTSIKNIENKLYLFTLIQNLFHKLKLKTKKKKILCLNIIKIKHWKWENALYFCLNNYIWMFKRNNKQLEPESNSIPKFRQRIRDWKQ